ncbi:Tetratricopeptide repeat protein 31 [Triplophysa tibetana]|uniref:Tetratricopeptide repeat protein 31 n=1 Tax=Triplophysa tibetana TaxID=1572043 RepID=A0A5A9P703_9TELE|nr:Tetratricopeptide repeat protein 31 [Triplophysa tibetana]
MSSRNKFGPEYFRMRDDACLMRNHEAMVDFITNRPPRPSILDALSLGYEFAPYEPSSDDDDYEYDDEQYRIPENHSYCGFSSNFLARGLPKPSRRITPEEAAKTAKELVDEEEKLKRKAEKKKQKKMRQRERRRLEKLEKENEDKVKNKQVHVDTGSVQPKPTDKDKNIIKNNNYSSVPPDPHHTTTPMQSSGDDDDDEEESTVDPEELDMSSCFVSNAAAIAKRKLEQKPKPEKRAGPPNSNKQHGSDQKTERTMNLENQTDNKKEAESDDTVDANDFITKSVEFAVIGNQYAAAGNLQMAVKYFTDAIKHNPKEYKLFGNRSFCYEKLLQYEKALTDAEITLSMNPKWIKGLYRKGKALVGLKRYYDARLTYSEILKLDRSCKDAAEELMTVQIMQLMDMGFTKEQSSNALIINGTVEKALESLSGLSGVIHAPWPRESEFMPVQRNLRAQAKVPLGPLPQNQPRLNSPVHAAPNQPTELFPVWVGDLVPSVTEEKLYQLFSSAGPVQSVRVLPASRCAFVNYIRKEDCEKAIQNLHGHQTDGTILAVRYPDRIHTRLGVSRDASTEPCKQSDECFFWRTTGCIKNERCTFRHIPENKGIDQHKGRSHQ